MLDVIYRHVYLLTKIQLFLTKISRMASKPPLTLSAV